MELASLIEGLSDAACYPHPVQAVQVRQTHISVVFLAGPYVYKVKKPVDLGFLDFTTLEKRRHFCQEEVRLNRRLAPAVYLGVVPVMRSATGLQIGEPGCVSTGSSGEPVEWAVKMERLPDEATLRQRLERGELEPALLMALADRIAGFHAQAERGPRIASFGRFDVVARNARENFEQAEPQIGVTLSRTVFDRLRALTEETLARLRPLIEARAERGVPCDTHGDLHLDHVYHFPDRQPPANLVILDCIEFNERFRYADPVADVAFLAMDLEFHGRRDLAAVFAEAYFRAARDEEGGALLPFYRAYRAAVRGKVEGFELAEKEIPQAERTAALARARSHWLLALRELEEPGS
jgi:aminoglycoside phosphotransferase family enzyme